MSTLSTIRTALAAAVVDVSGLTTLTGGIRSSAYILDQVNAPVVMVSPDDVAYDRTFGLAGNDTYPFTLRVLTGRTDEVAAQILLDELAEPTGVTSLKVAIEADRTLGGLVEDLHVTSFGRPTAIPVGDVVYVGADVSVTVIT